MAEQRDNLKVDVEAKAMEQTDFDKVEVEAKERTDFDQILGFNLLLLLNHTN